MADLADFAVGEQNFYDIESKFNSRRFQQPQIIERRVRKEPSLIEINRRRRSGPIFRRARLHFDKNQAIAVAEDQVYLPAWRTKIPDQELEPKLSQVPLGSLLSKRPIPQM